MTHLHPSQSDLPTGTPPDGWETTTQTQRIPTRFGNVTIRLGGNPQGQPMVFWPSLLLDASMWSYQYEHYAPHFRIILIDPPGIGLSDPLRQAIGVEDSAACLAEILDALGIGAAIVAGCSWGSLTALTFAAHHPQRVIAAVLTNGTATPPSAETSAEMGQLVAGLMELTSAPDWLLPATRNAFSGPTAEARKPEFVDYLARVLDEDPVSIAFAMKGILLGREDLHPVARQIAAVPVLVIAGAEDRFFSIAEAESLAGAIHGSRFVVLPETGHLSPRESPDLVNTEIDRFLDQVLTARHKT